MEKVRLVGQDMVSGSRPSHLLSNAITKGLVRLAVTYALIIPSLFMKSFGRSYCRDMDLQRRNPVSAILAVDLLYISYMLEYWDDSPSSP